MLYLAAAGLSVKCCLDLIRQSERFPAWFVPLFVVGVSALVAYGGLVVFLLWRHRATARPPRSTAVLVWSLLALSFVATSAVHQFYPFRPLPWSMYKSLDPILQLNLALTALGPVMVAALGVVYLSGRTRLARSALPLLGLVLLVPNDNCNNPFNSWWLATLGASPLMFVPNMYAFVFGVAVLSGLLPRLNTLALAGTGLAVGVLGLGHITRAIW